MSEPDVVIVGAGGHGRVLIDVLRRAGVKVRAAVDINPLLHGTDISGVPIVGDDTVVFRRPQHEVVLVNAQGNIPRTGDTALSRRRLIYEKYSERGYSFMSVVSPDAIVSATAQLSPGCQIITGAIVHPGAVIGMNTIINTGARVDHDCQIGAHSHIAPGTVLCGAVIVDDECHVGAGAIVIPGIRIGARALVGAGAVVVSNVAPGATILAERAQKRPSL